MLWKKCLRNPSLQEFCYHRRKIDSYQELFNLCPNIIGPEMYRLGCECPAPEYCFTVEYNEEYGG